MINNPLSSYWDTTQQAPDRDPPCPAKHKAPLGESQLLLCGRYQVISYRREQSALFPRSVINFTLHLAVFSVGLMWQSPVGTLIIAVPVTTHAHQYNELERSRQPGSVVIIVTHSQSTAESTQTNTDNDTGAEYSNLMVPSINPLTCLSIIYTLMHSLIRLTESVNINVIISDSNWDKDRC